MQVKGFLKNSTAEGKKYCDLRGIFCRHCEEESPSVIVIAGSLKNIHLLNNLTGTTRPDFFGKQSLSDAVAAYQEIASATRSFTKNQASSRASQ